MKSTRSGFTIVEVLVAIVILSIGIFALAGSSAAITRVVGGGKWDTLSAQVASLRMDRLRAAAAATNPRCIDPAFTSSAGPVTTQGVTETWVVPPNGVNRLVRVVTTFRRARGQHADTLWTRINCT